MYTYTSLIPRPSRVFQHCARKSHNAEKHGKAWEQGYTYIPYYLGHYGVHGNDKCGFTNQTVSIYDITSGVTLCLLVLAILAYILYSASNSFQRCQDSCHLICIMTFTSAFIALCIIAIIANTLFSFTSIVSVVYGEYDNWKTHNNCSSPAFYSAFAYVTAEFITLAVAILVIIALFIYACYKAF